MVLHSLHSCRYSCYIHFEYAFAISKEVAGLRKGATKDDLVILAYVHIHFLRVLLPELFLLVLLVLANAELNPEVTTLKLFASI